MWPLRGPLRLPPTGGGSWRTVFRLPLPTVKPPMATTFGIDHILHWFNQSPDAQKIRADHEAAEVAKRQAKVEEIAAARRKFEKEFPPAEAAVKAARAVVQ